MKKACLLIVFAVVTLCSCTKNNNTTTNNIIEPLPAFTVSGVHDLTFTNGNTNYNSLGISVQYSDSAQQVVALSLSALPQGITLDSTWITSGIPSFSTTLLFYDSTLAGATPGTYPMTLTVTSATSGKKTYPFNLKVNAEPSCVSILVGTYASCNSSCMISGGYYKDSVTADPTIVNKIWFYNVNGTGLKLYGIYNCNTEQIRVPSQTIGSVTYSGSGTGYYTGTTHFISLDISSNSGSSFCSVSMN